MVPFADPTFQKLLLLLIQQQTLYRAAFAEVLPHDVGGVFGLYVAVPDAIRVDYYGCAGAFFAVLALVEATARLYAGFVFLAAGKQRL